MCWVICDSVEFFLIHSSGLLIFLLAKFLGWEIINTLTFWKVSHLLEGNSLILLHFMRTLNLPRGCFSLALCSEHTKKQLDSALLGSTCFCCHRAYSVELKI